MNAPSDENPPPGWIPRVEACRITTLSRQRIESLIHSSKLPAMKDRAGHWHLEPVAVSAYAVDARARKAKRIVKERRAGLRGEGRIDTSIPIHDTADSDMQELQRLRARVRTLEDELAYEQQAAENRRLTEAAWAHADELEEGARTAARQARRQQLAEIHALEERIQSLRGPRHLGDLLGEEDGSEA